jgi:hypothetical protein
LAKQAKAKKAAKKKSLPVAASFGVRAVVEVPEGTPAFYTNFIEISNTPWDFSLILAKLPAKPNPSSIEEIKASGTLPVTAELTINFPPALMAGLIRALTTQKELYEKMTGTELKETPQ